MATTSRRLRCSNCGRGPSFAVDMTLEETGVCYNCSRPPCAECGKISRYTVEGISLCTSHRGLLAKHRPLPKAGG